MTESWVPRIVPLSDADGGANRSRLLSRIDHLARASTVALVATPTRSLEPRGTDDAGTVLGRHYLAVLAGAGESEADSQARALVGERSGSGVAVAPFDGLDAAALVDAACAACDRAAPGVIAYARDAVERITLGNRVALAADASTVRAYQLARRLATFELPVTVCGPTGSGKDLIAAALHHLSSRASRPLVALNCAAIPESLAEAELFGHAKGAFTGALAARPGAIEASSGGTLFLDEIAELSATTQARLLRVLESGAVQRIGETTTRPIDLRVIAATHRDLAAEVATGRFRKDLWYRLGVARIELAPLCDRPRDLAALVRRFIDEAGARSGRSITLAAATARALFEHSWPGNIRELRHAIEFAIATAVVDGNIELQPANLPELRGGRPRGKVRVVGSMSITAEVQALERTRMIEALAVCGGVQSKAAALIQMPLRSFVTKLGRYSITERDWRSAT